MTLTLEELEKRMSKNNGSLSLDGCTSLTTLPEGLTVGGWLYLNGCTSLTALPEGLTVGRSLSLDGCTSLTTLPEGLIVGGSLYGSGTISKRFPINHLQNGDYVAGRYLYADSILTHIKKRKEMNGITYFEGKIPGRNVVFDGVNYAHCNTFREGVADLKFKAARDRGLEQYKGIPLDKKLPVSELIPMYRHITGACQQGTQRFVDSFGENLEDFYTIQEVIDLTDGQYGAERFKEFFEKQGGDPA